MGVRGELFSTRMACDGRTYFFNVKQNRVGDLYLTIVESKPTEPESFDRRSIVVFQESSGEFLKALGKAIEAMHESAPEHRDAKPPRVKRDAMAPRDDGRDEESRVPYDDRPRHYIDVKRPRQDADSGERYRKSAGSTGRTGAVARRGPRDAAGGRAPGSPGSRSGAAARAVSEAAGRAPTGSSKRPMGRSATGKVVIVKKAAKPAEPAPAKPRKLKVRKADPSDAAD